MSTALVTGSGNTLDYAIAAWLHAKATRTGSLKTKRAYTDTIQRFRWALQHVGLDLDSDPARVADAAQGWAAQPWDSRRKEVTANTVNQRLAILSSFYTFARKRRLLSDNPISLIDRRPVQGYASARPVSDVAERMADIERETPIGKRDFALLGIALFTGRRLSEIAHLRYSHITREHGQATLTFRAKGGKTMHDTLPLALSSALLDYVTIVHGTPSPDTSVWVSLSTHHFGQPISLQGIADIYKRRLGVTKVHSSRHTFAWGMESIGAKVSDIQARLGHANLATTSRYLQALRSSQNAHGDALAALLGLTN